MQSVLAQDPANFDAVFQDSLLNLAKGDAAKAIRELEYLNNAYRNYRERPKLLSQLAVAYLAFAGRASPVDARRRRRKRHKPIERSHQARSPFRAGDPDVR